MLTAKLFGALSALVVLLALVGSPRSSSMYLHATYFIFTAKHLQLFIAVLSAIFALIYFSATRWSPHSLNNFLSLLHFVLTVVGVLLLAAYVAKGRVHGEPPPPLWSLYALEIGFLIFILGGFVFMVNLGVTMVKNLAT